MKLFNLLSGHLFTEDVIEMEIGEGKNPFGN